jgi:hypothetical protein
MFGSPVVAIVTLTLAFAFIYAGIKNQSIVDVLTGKTTAIQGSAQSIVTPSMVAPLLGKASTTTAPSTPTTKMA